MRWNRAWLVCFLPLIFAACLCSWLPSLPDTQATLTVDISYTDTFYRETFDYARDARNFRHVVLVIPEREAAGINPGQIFTNLLIEPDAVLMSEEEQQELAWVLDYLHEAPEGYFTGTFEPDTYVVAAAFIAAPLSREEADVGDDVILWAGVTGGGASTEFQTVTLEAGETTDVTFEMTDANGWACPWVYVFDGESFQRRTEVLRSINSRSLERTEITALGPVTVVDGFVILQLAEEKDEISYIDAFSLVIDDVPVYAESDTITQTALAAVDGHYLTLTEGDTVELRFRVPPSFVDGDSVSVAATGYYVPGG